jgi:hypothetical protein
VHDLVLMVNGEPPGGDQLALIRIYYGHSSDAEHMTRSHARVGDGGIRCTGYERELSDGEGRSITG